MLEEIQVVVDALVLEIGGLDMVLGVLVEHIGECGHGLEVSDYAICVQRSFG
jgi:hypothetical protein